MPIRRDSIYCTNRQFGGPLVPDCHVFAYLRIRIRNRFRVGQTPGFSTLSAIPGTFATIYAYYCTCRPTRPTVLLLYCKL
jgi:hypothetical protein